MSALVRPCAAVAASSLTVLVLITGGGPASAQAPPDAPAQRVTIVPPASTEPPATEPPATTSPPATTPTTARPRPTVTRARSTSTTIAKTTVPAPTTTLFVIPGQVTPAGPVTTESTLAPVVQNDDLPSWSINLFWIGIGGALAILVATFVLTGRSGAR